MIRRKRCWLLAAGLGVLGGFLALDISQSWSRIVEQPRELPVPQHLSEPPLEDWLEKARAGGKYRMLLHQFKSPKDSNVGAEFREMGQLRVGRYADQSSLPPGYWVYVKPYWYIWRDLTALPAPKRPWGPEQATGAPDTTAAGDFGTAWASLTPDGQDEVLLLEYAEPVWPSALRIHETWNPGAVGRVTLYRLDGTAVEAWAGRDPLGTDVSMGVSEIPLKIDFRTNRVRIDLRSREVRGWNEIDAVGLVDMDGKTHWAVAAEASSTAAGQAEQALALALALVQTSEQIEQLQREVRQLRAMVLELNTGKKE